MTSRTAIDPDRAVEPTVPAGTIRSRTAPVLSVLGGVLALTAAVLLYLGTNTASIAATVAQGRLVSTGMSDAALVEATYYVQLAVVLAMVVLGLTLVYVGGSSVARPR